MLRYKIVSDGPHRRKYASSFPEQRISQIPAVDITKPIELNPTDLDAFTEETAINWFDLGESQMLDATELEG